MNHNAVTQYLQMRLSADGPDNPTDGELLGAFATNRNETAFAALMNRHGTMVLGVCRRRLGNTADAEDAFQAAFLVLARRAAGLADVRSVSGWLYGVAVRVATKARTREARRQARERKGALMRQSEPSPIDDLAELRSVIDEEVDRLNARYRDPMVLCCLEGKSRKEAARLLGCP